MRLLAALAFLCALAGCAGYEAIRADKTLYQDLGGEKGIAALTNDVVDLAHANPAIRRHFEKIDRVDLKKTLAEQFCELSGGPCRYKGKDMVKAHKALDLSEADFNALVEDLRIACAKNGIPESAKNRLLALLAPMKRDVMHK
jgi:hemoglobin